MKQLLLGIIISIMATLTAVDIKAQQTQGQPPQAQLPSEQTAQNLAQLPSEIERPDLRYAPGEGNANKESWLPMPKTNSATIMSLAMMLSAYAIYSFRKCKTLKNKDHE